MPGARRRTSYSSGRRPCRHRTHWAGQSRGPDFFVVEGWDRDRDRGLGWHWTVFPRARGFRGCRQPPGFRPGLPVRPGDGFAFRAGSEGSDKVHSVEVRKAPMVQIGIDESESMEVGCRSSHRKRDRDRDWEHKAPKGRAAARRLPQSLSRPRSHLVASG